MSDSILVRLHFNIEFPTYSLPRGPGRVDKSSLSPIVVSLALTGTTMRLLRSTFIIVTNTAFSLHKLTAGINTRCGKDDAVEGQYLKRTNFVSKKSVSCL